MDADVRLHRQRSRARRTGETTGVGLVNRLCLKLPGGAFLPITATLTMLVLLVIMLPVYFTTNNSDREQTEAKTWPSTMTPEEFDILEKDQVNLEAEVISINPEEHRTFVVYSMHLGGVYAAWDELGMLTLPHEEDALLVTTGVQKGVKFEDGVASDDLHVEYLLTPAKRLFYYPFDAYEVKLILEATYVPATGDPEQLPLGVMYMGGRSGWSLTETFSALEGKANDKGVVVVVRMERSTAVKFCAVLVAIFMWAISLAMFSMSMNFVVDQDSEPGYDVPALAVGLLFALPFVRGVMPDVPDVGIAVDVLGYFWNIILVALSAVLTMNNILRKYRSRAQEVQEVFTAGPGWVGSSSGAHSLKGAGSVAMAGQPQAPHSQSIKVRHSANSAVHPVPEEP